MDKLKLTGRWLQLQRPCPFLILTLVGGILAIASPAHSGSAPSGAGSGVNPSGINQGQEQRLESTTPNATVNSTTGELVLTAAAQQSLNQTATGVFQGLQTTNPSLASLLARPAAIDLEGPSSVGPINIVGDAAEDEEATIGDIAAMAAAAINAGSRVALTRDQDTLTIEPLTTDIGGTSAVFVPVGGTPVVIPLRGTQGQVANAAGFLAAAFAAGIPPAQTNLFPTLALAGVDYRSLVPLFNAVGGLLPQTSGDAITVNPTQLEAAIQAYNHVLNSHDVDTLTTLGANPDFVVLGRSLQQLRAAVDP
jgi:hypothetical protein